MCRNNKILWKLVVAAAFLSLGAFGAVAQENNEQAILDLSPIPLVEKELDLPWFERFVHSGGVSRLEQTQQFSLSNEIEIWSPGERFDMTLEILGDSYLIDPESVEIDGFTARAKYNLSPSLSIGGSLGVTEEIPLTSENFTDLEEEKEAQIKIESAIRF